MDNHNLEIRINQNEWSDSASVLLRSPLLPNGKYDIVTELITKEQNRHEYIGSTFSLAKSELQSLMNQLWSMGLRPSDFKTNNEVIKVLQYHLEDMRKLAFINIENTDGKL